MGSRVPDRSGQIGHEASKVLVFEPGSSRAHLKLSTWTRTHLLFARLLGLAACEVSLGTVQGGFVQKVAAVLQLNSVAVGVFIRAIVR
jgi:hypothetical protein